MHMHPLLQTQQLLHDEATLIIESLLLPILTPYGDVTIGGSYAYQLLSHPDIDIDLVSEVADKTMFAQIVAQLIALPHTSKCTTGDRVNFPHQHPGTRPTGFWISPELHWDDRVWKLDIWLQRPAWHTGQTNHYQNALRTVDDATRVTILSLKEELRAAGRYGVGKDFCSADVYEGVLKGNVTSVSDLEVFIQQA